MLMENDVKWEELMKDCTEENLKLKKVFLTSDSLDILFFPTSSSFYFQLINKEFIDSLNSVNPSSEKVKTLITCNNFKQHVIDKFPENFYEMIQSEEIAFAFYKDKVMYFVHREAARQLIEKLKLKHLCSPPYNKVDLILLYQAMHLNNINLCCSTYRYGIINIVSTIEEITPSAMKNVNLLLTNFKAALPTEHEFVSYDKNIETNLVTVYLELPEYSKQAFVCGLEYVFSLDGEEISLTLVMSNKNIAYEDRYYIKLHDFKCFEKFSMKKVFDIFNSVEAFDKETLLALDRQKIVKVLELEDIYGKQRIRDMIIPEFATKYEFIKFVIKIPSMFENVNTSPTKKNKLDKRISNVFKNPYLIF